MPKWLPGLVLPNIQLNDAIDIGPFAFAPRHDPRVQEIIRESADFALFIDRFSDAFGVPLNPTVFIAADSIPASALSMSMASTLRDAVSLSVIPKSHASMLIWDRSLEFGFSDALDLYPWVTTISGNGHMEAQTPALRAFHVVQEFHGQSSPLLSIQHLASKDIDWPLFDELKLRWARRFAETPAQWADIALFRSLDMANAAAKIPAGRDMNEYSSGRSIANWISAFEILIHPGAEGRVGHLDVYRMLETVKWGNKECLKTYPTYITPKKREDKILPCWLYGELYHARNDFAHGNPVDSNRLKLPSGRYLHYYAPPLYRMALTAFLELVWSLHTDEKEGSVGAKRWYAQQTFERALATVHKPPRRG